MKKNKLLLMLLILFVVESSFCQHSAISGEYYYSKSKTKHASSGDLKLRDNGVFFYEVTLHDISMQYSGNWIVKEDTVFLKSDTISNYITELPSTSGKFYNLHFVNPFWNMDDYSEVVTYNELGDSLALFKTEEGLVKIPASEDVYRLKCNGGSFQKDELIIFCNDFRSNNLKVEYSGDNNVQINIYFILQKNGRLLDTEGRYFKKKN